MQGLKYKCSRTGFKPKLSAFMLAVIITIVCVSLSTNSVMFITYAISHDAASNMARKVTQLMMEKATLRVKNSLDKVTGIAEGAQAGLMMYPSAPIPADDPDQETWFKKWDVAAVMHEKTIGFQSYGLTYLFDDGSFVAVGAFQDRIMMTCDHSRGNNLPVASVAPLINVSSNYYNYTTMRYLKTLATPVYFDPRDRVGYNRSLKAFDFSYGNVDIAASGFVPTMKIMYAMYNASMIFIGMGEVKLRLDSFEAIVEDQRPTPHSYVVLLSRARKVIATGITGSPGVVKRIVPSTYSMSAEEKASGCSLSDNLGTFDRNIFCLKNYKDFGYAPLRILGEKGLIPKTSPGFHTDATKVTLGDEGTFYIAIVDYNLYFPSLDWISIVFVPEEEILKDIVKGRNIAIAISCGVAIFFAIVNGVLIRFIMRPLSAIAERMKSSAYLKDDPSREDSDLNTESTSTDFNLRPKAIKPKESRVLSYLADVASIQSAYWRMSDELGVLRGYIPEHVRDQLLGSQEKTQEGDFSRISNISMKRGSAGAESFELSALNANDDIPADVEPKHTEFDLLSQPPQDGSFSPSDPDRSVSPTHEKCTNFVDSGPLTQKYNSNCDQIDGHATESLRNLSEDLNKEQLSRSWSEPIPFFAGNGLVERSVTIALVNIVGLHQHMFSKPANQAIKEHEYFVAYIHEVARRLGGVLDNFNGDKFWVSFNASTLCENSAVAATLFAHEVAATVNGEAAKHRRQMTNSVTLPDGKPPLSPQRPRFRVALSGVTIGVATGRAYVGPLGTRHIRRHAVISSAMCEAFAFERLAARYPDCGVMVGGDMIPAIEGYFQYLLLDAMALPGSNGLRRRIASIKGLMHCRKQPPIPVHMDWPRVVKRLPSKNPFESANECFNAFLEGRSPEVTQRLGAICNHVDLSRQFHLTRRSSVHHLPDGRSILSPSECDSVALMVGFLSAVATDDGRQYRSPLGGLFERQT